MKVIKGTPEFELLKQVEEWLGIDKAETWRQKPWSLLEIYQEADSPEYEAFLGGVFATPYRRTPDSEELLAPGFVVSAVLRVTMVMDDEFEGGIPYLGIGITIQFPDYFFWCFSDSLYPENPEEEEDNPGGRRLSYNLMDSTSKNVEDLLQAMRENVMTDSFRHRTEWEDFCFMHHITFLA